MSKRLSLLAALALLASACSPETPSAPAADATAPAADATATAPEAAAPATPAPVQGLHAITAEQLAEVRTPAPASCNVEAAGKGVFATAPVTVERGVVKFSGWFLSEASRSSAVPGSLRIVDEAGTTGWETSLSHRLPRPDVTTSMKAADNGDTGFAEEVDASQFAPGNYRVSVVFDDNGKQYACSHDRVISVQ